MTVNCYICGAKTSIPIESLGIGDRVMCDECKKKYGKSNVAMAVFEDMKNQSKKADKQNEICVKCGAEIKGIPYYIVGLGAFCEECALKYDKGYVLSTKAKDNQSAKADSGKPNLSLVPKQIIYEIEKVRNFGVQKYKEPDNWKKVELERYHQALLRHTLAIWNDVQAKDKESGLLHLSHIACNIAFILELMNDKENEK